MHRRCLMNCLHEKYKYEKKQKTRRSHLTLNDEVEPWIMDSENL